MNCRPVGPGSTQRPPPGPPPPPSESLRAIGKRPRIEQGEVGGRNEIDQSVPQGRRGRCRHADDGLEAAGGGHRGPIDATANPGHGAKRPQPDGGAVVVARPAWGSAGRRAAPGAELRPAEKSREWPPGPVAAPALRRRGPRAGAGVRQPTGAPSPLEPSLWPPASLRTVLIKEAAPPPLPGATLATAHVGPSPEPREQDASAAERLFGDRDGVGV